VKRFRRKQAGIFSKFDVEPKNLFQGGWTGMKESTNNTTQEALEKRLKKVIDDLMSKPAYIAAIMEPKLVACDEAERTATMEFPVRDWQSNPYEGMHGGLIASAFDEALGLLAFCLNEENKIATINLSINYLKPIPLHDAILITAKVTSKGKRIITTTGECRLKSNGLLTNTAQIVFSVL
jgi:uncharacterized protein (TIGR00369 family)